MKVESCDFFKTIIGKQNFAPHFARKENAENLIFAIKHLDGNSSFDLFKDHHQNAVHPLFSNEFIAINRRSYEKKEIGYSFKKEVEVGLFEFHNSIRCILGGLIFFFFSKSQLIFTFCYSRFRILLSTLSIKIRHGERHSRISKP